MPAARRTRRPVKKTTKRAPAKPTPVEPPPTIPAGQRLYILDVPFNERAIASANGARWHAGMRATIYVGSTLPHGLSLYESKPFSWERWLEDDANNSLGPVPIAQHSLIPRTHQKEAADTIVRAAKAGARGFLLADDVGLGKTITAISGVLELKKIRPVKNLLIVCPLSVVPHWRRTITDMGVAQQGVRVCIINYDRLKKLLEVPASAQAAKRTATKNRRIAKEGIPIVDWNMVLADESHKLKNPSQRTKAAERIFKYAESRENAPFILWISATAGQNPLELSYLSPMLAQATKSPGSSLKAFGPWLISQGFHVTHEPRFDQWIWTEEPQYRAADVKKIYDILFTRRTPLAIRRIPTDIAGWPEIQRILYPVELDIMQTRLYEEAWTEFRREMKLAQRGKDSKAGFVAKLRFRQKASLIRVHGTVEHTLDMLDNGHQVAISCQFIESLDAIKEQLEKHKVPVTVMDGRDPKGREDNRLAFQTGKAKVCLFTPVEGISLHQKEMLEGGKYATDVPRSLIIHDPRYSGIESLQLEGRTHRDSQSSPAYYMYGEGTVEEDIVKNLLSRVGTTKAMVGDDTETIRILESILNGTDT